MQILTFVTTVTFKTFTTFQAFCIEKATKITNKISSSYKFHRLIASNPAGAGKEIASHGAASCFTLVM